MGHAGIGVWCFKLGLLAGSDSRKQARPMDGSVR